MLVVVAAFVGETVATANTPLLAYLKDPLLLPLFMGTYGGPALLIRDAWARGWIGWPGALLAGVAYTAFNEGVVADTWFSPHALDLSPFRLGRAGGVNWCLVAGLCLFHTVVSMGIPIAVVGLWRGDRPLVPWLRAASAIAAAAVPAILVAVVALAPRVPDQGARTLAAAVMVAAVCGARLAPRPVSRPRRGAPSRRRAYVTGLGFGTAFFALFLVVPAWLGIATVPLDLVLAGLVVRFIVRAAATHGWNDEHWVALIAGGLTCSMMINLLLVAELQPVVTVAAVICLVALDRQVRARAASRGSAIRATSHRTLMNRSSQGRGAG